MDDINQTSENRDFTYLQILKEYEQYLSYRDTALKWGLIGLLVLPFTFMILLFFMPSRVVFLALWIITFICIAIFLSYVDYKGYYYRKLLNIDEDAWRKKKTEAKDRRREEKIKERKEAIKNGLNTDYILKESKRKKKARKLLKKRHKQRKKLEQKRQLKAVKERQLQKQNEEYSAIKEQLDSKIRNIKERERPNLKLGISKPSEIDETKLTEQLNRELNENQSDDSSEND